MNWEEIVMWLSTSMAIIAAVDMSKSAWCLLALLIPALVSFVKAAVKVNK